jgi:hypothetical protein
MPRYFFDVVDDKNVYDKKGVTLPNEKAAREHAITLARELMESKSELLGESWSKWSVQVCNGKFDRILKIPFAKAIAASPTAQPESSPTVPPPSPLTEATE